MKTFLTVLLILDAPLFFILAWWSSDIKTAYKKFEDIAKLILGGALPSVGDEIYLPNIPGRFVGGKAKVVGLVENYVIVEEHGGASYRWKNGLKEIQKDLEKQFGNQRAYANGSGSS